MKSTHFVVAVCLFAIPTVLSYAGPGASYLQQRRAERTSTHTVVPAETRPASDACCQTVLTRQSHGAHKVAMPVRSFVCGGCPAMDAGQACPMP